MVKNDKASVGKLIHSAICSIDAELDDKSTENIDIYRYNQLGIVRNALQVMLQSVEQNEKPLRNVRIGRFVADSWDQNDRIGQIALKAESAYQKLRNRQMN